MSDHDSTGSVPNDGQLHGPELRAAMKRSGATPPDALGVCMTALDSGVKTVIDEQSATEVDPEFLEGTRKALIDSGLPFDEESVRKYARESMIGGAFTYGIGTGLNLAAGRREGDDVIERADLDSLATSVGHPEQPEKWAARMGIEPEGMLDFLRWLLSDELESDTPGRVGYAFQIGFEAGRQRREP
jgi:hypothetical protein